MTLRRVLAVALLPACGSEEAPVPTWTCADCCVVPDAPGASAGACAGVSQTRLCDGDACIPAGATCASTIPATGGGHALLDAAAEAAAGDCIAVGAGMFDGPVTVRAGVGVFGVGVEWTTVSGGFAFEAGADSRLRGVHVVGGRPGLDLSGSVGAVVEETTIEGAALFGVKVRGTDVRMTSVLVQGTAIDRSLELGAAADADAPEHYGMGIRVFGSTLTLDRVLVRDNGGYGAAFTPDAAAETPEAVIRDSRIEGSGLVGVEVEGTRVTLDGSEIRTTRLGGYERAVAYLLDVQLGGDVEMTGSSLRESELVGLYVKQSRFSSIGCEVTDSAERGVWLNSVGDPDNPDARSVLFEDTLVSGSVMGYGGMDAYGVVIQAGTVSRTGLLETGCETVACALADGIQVLDGSQFAIDGTIFEMNQRAAILFDGEGSGGSCTNCFVDRGGGQFGIVIQNNSPPPPDGAFSGSTDADGAAVQPEQRPEGMELPVAWPLEDLAPPDDR